MEIFLIRALQFMLAISILVLLHEGGHFFFAKLFGIRVEKFFLFFDPWFHLFQFKPKKSHTTYGIGWLPLGGYCKIAGMIDESFDKEQMSKPAQPWEFRTKPAWQRLLVMIGGVLVNFLLALFIYAMILFAWGDSYIPLKNMTHGMKFNTEAKALGFKDGDILIGTEKRPFKEFGVDLYRDLSEAKKVDIVRNGKPMTIALPGDLNMLGMLKSDPTFVSPLIPAEVDSVVPQSPADKAGLKKGCTIVSLNGKPIDSFNSFRYEIGRLDDLLTVAKSHQDSLKVRSVTLVYSHDNRQDTVKTVLNADLTMGFNTKSIAGLYQRETIEYGFWESFPAGASYGMGVLKGYVDDMKYVFSADGAKSLGGFGAIGSLFPPTWDWYMFWRMTAFLSIILAFMNILPIPALDGGHVLFLLYEMITRRKPSEDFLIKAEYVGFALLILLMLVANLNDILRWLGYM
ncbi:MAG: RIP metalloprotease RseP [Prevotella sp.]|nr:RIP metalloprotease RseP [Prevotella sp.]MDY5657012.1 RIP metalloprotease RseP [Prevotella sp.]